MAAPQTSEWANPQQALMELLEVLANGMNLSVSHEQLEQASTLPQPEMSWTQQLEEAAAGVGLRVRWMVAPIEDVFPLARPDLPVIGRSDDGGWWVLDGKAPGLVHAVPIADPRGPQWLLPSSLRRRMGADSRTWGMVEPVLPAAPLACPDGRRPPAARLRQLLWVERQDVAVVMLYGAVAGLLSLATPLAIQVLINWLAFGALLQPVLILGVALGVCLFLAASLQVLQRMGVETIERRLFVRTVADLAARLSRVRVEALDGMSGPELANRFFDVLTLQKAASTLLLDGFTAVLQVGVAVVLLALYNPWLLLFDLFLLLGMFGVLLPLGRGAQATAIQESKAKYAVAAWIEEVARHPVMLRQDGAQLAELRADSLARHWLHKRQSHFWVFLRQFAGVQTLQVLMSTVLLVSSGALVLRGELTIGQLVAAEFIVTTALLGFAKFADKLDTVYDLLAGVDKLGNLLDLQPEQPQGIALEDNGPVNIELDEATLTYGDGRRLPPVSLTLDSGSRTIIFGDPGSGKSTLGALVTGVRSPSSGVVRRDGVDLQHVRPQSRYRDVVRIGVHDILAGSIRDNVALGRLDVSDPMVWDALAQVGLRRRVEAMSDGLEAGLDPLGAPLSEPELRALLIARAVVGQPRLIVVDGVLDGLPARLREDLQRPLSEPGRPWTLLVLTSDPHVVDPNCRTFTLGSGGLDERPTLVTR